MESAMQHILPVKAEISSDMAPFALPLAFPRPRCISNGQLTPPPSPHGGDQGASSFGVKQKRQNTNLTIKLPQIWRKTIHCTSAPYSIQQHDAQMATLNEPHSHGFDTRTLRNPSPSASASASAPASSTFTSALTEHMTKSDESPTVPLIELRRISQSYYNLRHLAQEHEKETHFILPAVSRVHTPLLPSPVFREHQMMSAKCLPTSHQFENSKHINRGKDDPSYTSYDDLQILSCYENARHPSSDNIANVTRRSSTMPDFSTTRASDDIPEPYSDGQEYFEPLSTSSAESGESDWFANTTSHQQRLRKFKARCYQVVQHPFRANAPKYDEEGKVMLATVLVGPGKPKLVQIQRPPSSNNSLRSKSSSNPSTPSLKPPNSAVWDPPSTPAPQTREISKFSPYDTPSVFIPSVDVSQTVCNNSRPSVDCTTMSTSKPDLVPKPLDIVHHSSSDSEDSVFSTTDRRLRSLARKFSLSPSSKTLQSNSTTATTWTDDDITSPSPALHKMSPRQMRRNKLDKKLDAITSAIDNFPNTMLDLESSIMDDLRTRPSKTKNALHIDNLSKVFVDTPRQLLSCLTAWVIIDNYVSSLHFSQDHIPAHRTSCASSNSAQSKKPSFQARGYSLEAIKVNTKTSPDLQNGAPLRPTPVLPRAQSFPSRDEQFFESSDTIHLIPLKARSILGLDQQHMWKPDEHLLVTRARALSLSIGVVAQKMVEVLKGGRTWDPYLWRALGVVVGTIEESDV